MPLNGHTPVLGPELARLASAPEAERHAGGYTHTVREICQQPELWEATAGRVSAMLEDWREGVRLVEGIVLTGSGSSCYVGDCIAQAVQAAAGRATASIASGDLLTSGSRALPPWRPLLLVSFARSGDSPESAGLIRGMLAKEGEITHLAITCNRKGRLAANWSNGYRDPRVRVVTLDDRTCDRSLVMTSSFTNLAVAGLGLGYGGRAAEYRAEAASLAAAGRRLLEEWSDALAGIAATGYDRMIVVGDGGSYGAAREAALKTLEMTDGRVLTMAETFLGFRHGPMCALRQNTVLLAFVANDPVMRAYQLDLLEEVRRKGVGERTVAVGSELAGRVQDVVDLAIDLPELKEVSDDWAPLLHAVVGQLLGFFRCRFEGLRPDEPAARGAISRVVGEFTLHGVT